MRQNELQMYERQNAHSFLSHLALWRAAFSEICPKVRNMSESRKLKRFARSANDTGNYKSNFAPGVLNINNFSPAPANFSGVFHNAGNKEKTSILY
jgi:hypothetical protein